eukprot:RCo048098
MGMGGRSFPGCGGDGEEDDDGNAVRHGQEPRKHGVHHSPKGGPRPGCGLRASGSVQQIPAAPVSCAAAAFWQELPVMEPPQQLHGDRGDHSAEDKDHADHVVHRYKVLVRGQRDVPEERVHQGDLVQHAVGLQADPHPNISVGDEQRVQRDDRDQRHGHKNSQPKNPPVSLQAHHDLTARQLAHRRRAVGADIGVRVGCAVLEVIRHRKGVQGVEPRGRGEGVRHTGGGVELGLPQDNGNAAGLRVEGVPVEVHGARGHPGNPALHHKQRGGVHRGVEDDLQVLIQARGGRVRLRDRHRRGHQDVRVPHHVRHRHVN